ncbi:hypothetical protein M413DRAFT_440339 [Hebeloma cylindrosporum]|uniref:Uncharacterized protein n=1 Tax=Hebeloma cylindrosporum TaxID=76867 RepID=A0A0C2Z0T0_HEBCY|nr:hypothetical protein M413DRAFT_440339 [Hebeloma cylindrosporum h7]
MSPALQTLTHSSGAEPSATATPPHESSFTAGSPPLVLGFLAIAIFTAAMVVVFGWRRIQMRGWTIGGISAAEVLSGNVIPVVMKKPKLWDLRNGGQPEHWQWGEVAIPDPRGPGYAYTDGQWASIMPLSAKAVSVSEIRDKPPPSLPAFGSYHLRHSQAPQGEPNLFNRFLPRAWRWRSSKPNKNTPPGSAEPSTRLQVGVAIIMPSPEFPLYVKKRTNNDTYKQEIRKRNVITDFSIGIYECTWNES